ncbi:MAG: hypothetical protein V1834_02615 [Candidatus Micrarchaeota archaeon]
MVKCKKCGVPFHGIGGHIARLMGVRKSGKHADYCNKCEGEVRVSKPKKTVKRKAVKKKSKKRKSR